MCFCMRFVPMMNYITDVNCIYRFRLTDAIPVGISRIISNMSYLWYTCNCVPHLQCWWCDKSNIKHTCIVSCLIFLWICNVFYLHMWFIFSYSQGLRLSLTWLCLYCDVEKWLHALVYVRVITRPCYNFIFRTKLPLSLGHEWLVTFHCFTRMYLLTIAPIPMLLVVLWVPTASAMLLGHSYYCLHNYQWSNSEERK